MATYKNDCPVPFDQQPLNEYLSLKKSFLFSWSLSRMKTFLSGFFVMFVMIFIIIGFLLLPFTYKYNVWRILLISFLISNLILLFIFTRLYLGWSYVVKRLLSATIFYEESGWYDGQVWIKTSDYLIQDRLVGFYQVMPYILRIKYVCLILIITVLFFFICYNIL